MTQETPKEPVDQPAKEGSWLTYVVVVFVLIFVLGLIVAPRATFCGMRAPQSKAATMEQQIETACLAYMTEYGALPSTSENYRLIKILKGESKMEGNPRAIAFLTVKPEDLTTNGELIDPWKIPYRITFDANSKVHVLSAGPDKVFGTPDDMTNQP